MMLWFVLALMTGAAVLAILWPLSASSAALAAIGPEVAGDVAFYTAQLAEIDRDRDRGLIRSSEAEAARIESSRRLLRAASAPPVAVDVASEPALRRRRAASALSLCVVPIVALALYGVLGSPQAVEAGRGQADVPTALRSVEDHLAARPDDLRGWDLVAPIYLRVGRYGDSADAYRRARLLGGESVERLLGEGEARIAMAGGTVEGEARALFARALELDPASPGARFHLALAAEQEGDVVRAVAAYRGLIASAPAGAPWLGLVRSRLAGLVPSATTSGPATTLDPSTVSPEIAGMVAGMDERLSRDGGSEAEWGRLLRSLVVLGRRDDAGARYARARTAFASDPDSLRRLDDLAGELGLPREVARP